METRTEIAKGGGSGTGEPCWERVWDDDDASCCSGSGGRSEGGGARGGSGAGNDHGGNVVEFEFGPKSPLQILLAVWKENRRVMVVW